MKLFKQVKEQAVDYCERCLEACGAGCRRAALRERALMQALRNGARF